jgi:hypothetical protein
MRHENSMKAAPFRADAFFQQADWQWRPSALASRAPDPPPHAAPPAIHRSANATPHSLADPLSPHPAMQKVYDR